VLLGSVALHLASHGRSPVAVVPSGTSPDGTRGAGPILLGVDASVGCEDAIGYAFDEAHARGVELIAALVVDDSTVPPFVRGPARPGSLEDQEEQDVLTAQLAGWARRYPRVTVRPAVLRGRPAGALLDCGLGQPPGSRPCMVVIGSRGRGGLAGLLLGSTGQNLITHAVWPVVVVRPGTVRLVDEREALTSTRVESLASAE
jgi:nucleotide-binding universal stress UspA family protein